MSACLCSLVCLCISVSAAYLCVSACISVLLPVCLSVCLSAVLSLCLYVSLFLSVCFCGLSLFVCAVFVSASVFLSVSAFVCLYAVELHWCFRTSAKNPSQNVNRHMGVWGHCMSDPCSNNCWLPSVFHARRASLKPWKASKSKRGMQPSPVCPTPCAWLQGRNKRIPVSRLPRLTKTTSVTRNWRLQNRL